MMSRRTAALSGTGGRGQTDVGPAASSPDGTRWCSPAPVSGVPSAPSSASGQPSWHETNPRELLKVRHYDVLLHLTLQHYGSFT